MLFRSLHRGIAARQFQRRFVLAEGIEVNGASLENGLLHIALSRPEPRTISRTIEIKDGETKAAEKSRVSADTQAASRVSVGRGEAA